MINNIFLRNIEVLWDRVEDRSIYPFSIPSLQKITNLEFKTNVTFIVGENGSGKSTLLEAIALTFGINPEGGSRHANFSTEDTHSKLYQYIKTIKGPNRPRDWYFLRAESFYNLASYIGETGTIDYGDKELHKQSHGESFMALLDNRLGEGNNFYLFDEPEAALSPDRQLQALVKFHQLAQSGAQIIITTHSPILMAYPHATIYLLDEQGINPIKYEDTDHYKTTKSLHFIKVNFMYIYKVLFQFNKFRAIRAKLCNTSTKRVNN